MKTVFYSVLVIYAARRTGARQIGDGIKLSLGYIMAASKLESHYEGMNGSSLKNQSRGIEKESKICWRLQPSTSAVNKNGLYCSQLPTHISA